MKTDRHDLGRAWTLVSLIAALTLSSGIAVAQVPQHEREALLALYNSA